jgi:hypothetical protein
MKIVLALTAFVLLPSLADVAAAEDRVAQLSKVTGNVTIRRDGATVDTARQQGPRVMNGSVFAGNEVGTDSGATATMLFTDGTTIDLKEKTRLTVREVEGTPEAVKEQKRLGRVLKVLAGDVLAHVVANPEVATEFETPNGVAAVKGTKLELSVR